MNPLDPADQATAAGFGAQTGFADVGLALALAFVLGTFVAWLYVRTHRGLSYSRNIVHSLVLLCMIVAMVMMVVGNSIATAFGLVGALAIIRFRTVVRDSRDTTFIFLAIAVGIAIGVEQYPVAVAGALGIGTVAALLQATNFATRHADTGVLRVRTASAEAPNVETVIAQYCSSHDLVSARNGNGNGGGNGDGASESELSYRIRMYAPAEQHELVESVRALTGTSHVAIMLDEGAEEW